MSTDSSARPPLDLTVRAALDGWPVDVHLSLPAERVSAALVRLAELGYSPRPEAAPAQAGGKPRAPRAEPLFQPDGTPCCPTHRTPLRENDRGTFFCPKKAGPGEDANERGYCRYSWRP